MTAQEDLTGMPTPKQDERTPGPWVTHDDGNLFYVGLEGEFADGHDFIAVAECYSHSLISRKEAEANAEFIASAVNAYTSTEALREALETAQEAIRRWLTWCDDWHAGKLHPFDDLEFGRSALVKARTALAGVTAPTTRSFNEHMVEDLIVAAYKRGFIWANHNPVDGEFLDKAARDYADYTMNAPSAGVTALSEVVAE